MAFNLGDILVNIKANTDGLKKGIADVTDMGNQTKTLGQKVQDGMKVAAAGLAVVGAGLTLYAKGAVSYTQDLVTNSKALGREIGTTTTEASRLSAAMERMGVDAGSTQQMFGVFAKQIQAASSSTDATRIAAQSLSLQVKQTQKDINDTTAEIQKSGDKSGDLTLKLATLQNKLDGLNNQLATSANGFDKLGISTVNADGTQKSFTDILGETADKFKAMPDGVGKTTLAMDLFGKSGKDMIKVLNLGSSGISDLEKNADALGLTLNENTIGKINDLVQSQKALKEQTDALKIAVGTATAPIMTSFNTVLNDMIGSLLNTKGPVHDVTVGVLAYGGPIASAAAATLGFLANLDQALPLLAKMANATKLAAVAQWLWNIAMISNPIGLIIAAIVGIVAILAVLYFNVDSVRQAFDTAFNFIWGIVQSVYNWIAQNWPYLLGILLGPIGIAAAVIYMNFDTIKNIASTAWDFIVGVWQGGIAFFKGIADGIGSAISGAFSGIANVVTGAWDGIKNGFKAAANWVIDQANKLIGAYNNTIGKIPGVPNIGKIPKFAKGTEDFAGGGAIVGEQGAELGLFPSGTKIVPHNLTANLVDNLMSVGDMLKTFLSNGAQSFLAGNQLAGAGAGVTQNTTTNINGPINIDSQQDADYFFKRIDRNTQLQGFGISTINPPGAP